MASQQFESSAVLERVERGNLCSGCGLCASLAPDAISMNLADDGFIRPKQIAGLSQENERSIAQTCPGLGQSLLDDNRAHAPMWGPVQQTFTGWSTDPRQRYAGASGGALTAIAASLVESGRVDCVIQVGADPERPQGNCTIRSSSIADISEAAGSRYAPSAPLSDLASCLLEYRNEGRRFAVIGKPCDAAGLRAWTAIDDLAARAFPVVLSFFCGGAPSEHGASALVRAMGIHPGQLQSLRYRGNGWPGKAVASAIDGETAQMSYAESWGKILSRHVQHRCKICADSSGMMADLVCADAWETDASGYPVFEDAPGKSLILTRSALGAEILREAQVTGHVELEDFDLGTLDQIQPGQRDRRRAVLARLAAQWITGRPIPRYRGLHLLAMARQNGVKRNLRNFVGMFKRLRAQAKRGVMAKNKKAQS